MSSIPDSRFFRNHRDRSLLAASQKRQGHWDADLFLDQQPVQIIDVPNGLVAIADYHIAFCETRSLRRACRLDRHDENPALSRQVVKTDDSPRQLHMLP